MEENHEVVKRKTNFLKILIKNYNLLLFLFSAGFFVWATLVFLGIGDFIEDAETTYIEPLLNDTGDIEYWVLIDLKTEGGFISGNPVFAKVEIISTYNKGFDNEEYWISLGGDQAFEYPKQKDENGFLNSSVISLYKTNDKNKIEGFGKLIFDKPGNFPLYTNIISSPETIREGIEILNLESSNAIYISESSNLLFLQQNKRIFALTLILIAFALFELGKNSKNYYPMNF